MHRADRNNRNARLEARILPAAFMNEFRERSSRKLEGKVRNRFWEKICRHSEVRERWWQSAVLGGIALWLAIAPSLAPMGRYMANFHQVSAVLVAVTGAGLLMNGPGGIHRLNVITGAVLTVSPWLLIGVTSFGVFSALTGGIILMASGVLWE